MEAALDSSGLLDEHSRHLSDKFNKLKCPMCHVISLMRAIHLFSMSIGEENILVYGA